MVCLAVLPTRRDRNPIRQALERRCGGRLCGSVRAIRCANLQAYEEREAPLSVCRRIQVPLGHRAQLSRFFYQRGAPISDTPGERTRSMTHLGSIWAVTIQSGYQQVFNSVVDIALNPKRVWSSASVCSRLPFRGRKHLLITLLAQPDWWNGSARRCCGRGLNRPSRWAISGSTPTG